MSLHKQPNNWIKYRRTNLYKKAELKKTLQAALMMFIKEHARGTTVNKEE